MDWKEIGKISADVSIWIKNYPGKGKGAIEGKRLDGYLWMVYLDTGEVSSRFIHFMSGTLPTLEEAKDEVDEVFDLIERFS